MATEQNLSNEALRDSLLTLLDDLAARCMPSDFNIGVPNVGALNYPAQWKAALLRATPFELRAIGDSLGVIETNVLRREKQAAQWKADDERRERAALPLDPGRLVLEPARTERAGPDPPDLPGGDEVGLLQHAHVLPHAGQGQVERLG